jgi:hypothetical protein
VHAELTLGLGLAVNHKRIARLMREAGIQASTGAAATVAPSEIRTPSPTSTWSLADSDPTRALPGVSRAVLVAIHTRGQHGVHVDQPPALAGSDSLVMPRALIGRPEGARRQSTRGVARCAFSLNGGPGAYTAMIMLRVALGACRS